MEPKIPNKRAGLLRTCTKCGISKTVDSFIETSDWFYNDGFIPVCNSCIKEYLIEYDKTDPISIEVYSQKLIGKTFREICEEDEARQSTIIREEDERYGETDAVENKRNKGNLGQIIEERFFHYACNSDARADFYEAGVELKVTPYRINQNGSLSAKERLILTMIDYFQVVNETFEESHFWNKSKLILLVYYLYMKEIKFNLDYENQEPFTYLLGYIVGVVHETVNVYNKETIDC